MITLNPPPGQFVNVQGKSMHIHCLGSGRPTVVAEAGSGEDSLTWTLLQNALADQLRFCAYDRAGMGWSERQSGQRDADSVAQQLRALLAVANESGPFVLLGHSLGGLYIRDFQQMYPSETKALIFLDAVTPAAYIGKPGATLGLDEASIERRARFPFFGWFEEVTGYARFFHRCSEVPKPLIRIQKLYEADQRIASQDSEQRREGQAINADLRELSSRPIDIPALVLSEDKSPTLQTPEAIASWNNLQASLLILSPQSYRVVATRGDHFIQIDCAGFATDEIRKFLQPRETHLSQYGTTTFLACK